MNRLRLVQAGVCFCLGLLCLLADQGLVAALLALAACGYVAMAMGE